MCVQGNCKFFGVRSGRCDGDLGLKDGPDDC